MRKYPFLVSLVLLPLILLTFATPSHAQNVVVTGSGLIPQGPTLPTTCNPPNVSDPGSQALFYHTTSSGGAIGLYQCTAVNTWAAAGGGSSAFPLTVSGATSGGIPCFTSTTTEDSSTLIVAGDIIQGGGAGACAADSGVLVSNLTRLALGSTQTLQCTQNGTCLIVKQSGAGGTPFIVQNSSGTSQFQVSPGGIFVVQAPQGFSSLNWGNTNNSHLLWDRTAPTVTGAGCGGSAASITANNGTAAFKVNVGTSNTGTCTITMPAATTDWVCSATDITTTSTTVSQTKSKPGGSPTTQISLQNYTDVSGTGAWTDSDVVTVSCFAE